MSSNFPATLERLYKAAADRLAEKEAAQAKIEAEAKKQFEADLAQYAMKLALALPAEVIPFVEWPAYETNRGFDRNEFFLNIPECSPINGVFGRDNSWAYFVADHTYRDYENGVCRWNVEDSKCYDDIAMAIYAAHQAYPSLAEAQKRWEAFDELTPVDQPDADQKLALADIELVEKLLRNEHASEISSETDYILWDIADKLTAIGWILLAGARERGEL
jgi:hypothetical protein